MSENLGVFVIYYSFTVLETYDVVLGNQQVGRVDFGL